MSTASRCASCRADDVGVPAAPGRVGASAQRGTHRRGGVCRDPLLDGPRERLLVVSATWARRRPSRARRDPLREADVLVLESTYGDRNHRTMADTELN